MTAIAAFLRKTPVIRLQDYFTAGGFTSLAPIDWPKPEPEVVESLIKAVDAMSDDEKQRVVLDAARVAALADEPGQNALQNVVVNRAVFDTLEGANRVTNAAEELAKAAASLNQPAILAIRASRVAGTTPTVNLTRPFRMPRQSAHSMRWTVS